MMKKMLCMFYLSFTYVLYEDYDASEELSDHVFNWFPNARVHRYTVLAKIHFDGGFGDCKPL